MFSSALPIYFMFYFIHGRTEKGDMNKTFNADLNYRPRDLLYVNFIFCVIHSIPSHPKSHPGGDEKNFTGW